MCRLSATAVALAAAALAASSPVAGQTADTTSAAAPTVAAPAVPYARSVQRAPAPGASASRNATPNIAASSPTVVAVRLDGTIQLDGVLDERAWAGARLAPPLVQRDPDEGAAPTEPSRCSS